MNELKSKQARYLCGMLIEIAEKYFSANIRNIDTTEFYRLSCINKTYQDMVGDAYAKSVQVDLAIMESMAQITDTFNHQDD